MRQRHGLPEKQRGTVAVMTGLAAITLVAFMGLSVDLGHAYVGTSELQNSADAAALAGAKELDQTRDGVTAARDKAIAIALEHNFNFSTPVAITAANIRYGSCPNASNTNTFGRPASRSPSCTFVDYATAQANPVGLTFLEVDTGTQNLNTYFMRVVAINTTSVAGYAVAGIPLTYVAPIGVCAIDPDNRTRQYTYPSDGSSELIELGFRRGISYNIVELNPLGGASGTPILINPVDVPPSGCDPNHSSASFTAPFVCNGTSAVPSNPAPGAQVYVNTGFSAGPIEKALNSRFDVFGGGSPCDPASAPPDSNIKEFKAANAVPPPPPPQAGHPRDWMEPGATTLPIPQTVTLNLLNSNKPNYWPISPYAPDASTSPPTPSTLPFAQYGALWSYTHAYHADGSSPPKAGTAYNATNDEWAKLYNDNATTFGGFDLLDSANYPLAVGAGFPAGIPPSPYNQTSGNYFEEPAPSRRPGTMNRRVLNIVIVDCSTLGEGGLSCAPLDVKGIGKFFMQVKADLTGSPKRIETEFAGLLDLTPIPDDVRLYR